MEATGKVLYVSKKRGFVTVLVPGVGTFYPEENLFAPELWKEIRKGRKVKVEVEISNDRLQRRIISVS